MFTCSLFKPILKVFLHSKLLCSLNLSVIREGTKSEKENKWTGRRSGIALRLGINFNELWVEPSFCEGLFEKVSLNSEVMRCYLRTTHEKHLYSISLTFFVKIVVSFANAYPGCQRLFMRGFRIPKTRIPDSTGKSFSYSGFYRQKFHKFRNPDSLTRGNN